MQDVTHKLGIGIERVKAGLMQQLHLLKSEPKPTQQNRHCMQAAEMTY